MILRPLLVLLIFFAALFYFKGPLSTVAPQFDQLHSAYSESFKQLFKQITSATSSSVLNVGQNYIPSIAGGVVGQIIGQMGVQSSTSSGVKTSTAPIVDAALSSPQGGSGGVQGGVLGMSETNSGELLPVISNQTEGSLSVSGIILGTNLERQKVGLPYLSLNKKLSEAAESKLQDMFNHQYFEHISPSGQSVSDVVRKTGYEYIVVGENLALGVFGGDAQVVAAWMASPGHKKNILDSRYQEIGIAVGRGVYQGRKQWLIVQHFAKPLSSCSSPDTNLKKSIESQKGDISALEGQITSTRSQIDSLSGESYIAKANEYNALVINYNSKLTLLKQTIDTYNETAREFNTCAGISNS